MVSRQYTLKRHSHNSLTPEKAKGEYDGTLVVYPETNSFVWFRDSGKKGGSVIDWYMLVNNCTTRTAIGELRHSLNGGKLRCSSPVISSKPTRKTQRVQDADWRQKAGQKATIAQNHLRNRKAAGVEYLEGKRYLDIDTCIRCGVGFDPQVYYSKGENDKWLTAPAVMFPYYSVAGDIVGIRYRWLKKIGSQKQLSRSGSNFKGAEFLLYYLMQRGQGSNVLFVVEGEMNALSIMACGYDAVSIGSEGGGISDDLIEFATRYDYVAVWTDGGTAAAAYAKKLNGVALRSPEVGLPNSETGETEIKERDANDLLGMKCLPSFIEQIVPDAVKMEIVAPAVVNIEPQTELSQVQTTPLPLVNTEPPSWMDDEPPAWTDSESPPYLDSEPPPYLPYGDEPPVWLDDDEPMPIAESPVVEPVLVVQGTSPVATLPDGVLDSDIDLESYMSFPDRETANAVGDYIESSFGLECIAFTDGDCAKVFTRDYADRTYVDEHGERLYIADYVPLPQPDVPDGYVLYWNHPDSNPAYAHMRARGYEKSGREPAECVFVADGCDCLCYGPVAEDEPPVAVRTRQIARYKAKDSKEVATYTNMIKIGGVFDTEVNGLFVDRIHKDPKIDISHLADDRTEVLVVEY